MKRPSRRPTPDKKELPRPADTLVLSRGKLWGFRIALWLGFPVLFFLMLEGVLRVAGFGYPTAFLLPSRIEGRPVFIQNDRFGWRFFGRDLSREPFPLALQKPKAPGTTRIFVFGESAAYGDPQPDFGLPRMLQALLTEKYPEHRFEVVNAAMTAINSHAILQIARDCARAQGDIWVVYMGNNEVVGPFGAGTVFGPQGAGLGLVRSSLLIKSTRGGQLLDLAVDAVHPVPESKREWGGMSMFLGSQIRQTDSAMAGLYDHFRRNLNDILAAAEHAGAKVILTTIPTNLKDCPPFASLHTPTLSQESLQEWQSLYRQAQALQEAGKTTEALDALSRAARLDDTYADLHYLWGRLCLDLGRNQEASTHFVQARDLDTLRFRADSRINTIIRDAAGSGTGPDHLHLVDLERLLAARSGGGIPGDEFLYEHVHLNFDGNYQAALSIAEEVDPCLPKELSRSGGSRAWPSKAQCAERLGWNPWAQHEALQSIVARVSDAPFTAQLHHAAKLGRMRMDLAKLAVAMSPAALKEGLARCEAAIALAPDDWVLKKERASLQEKTGDFESAASSWRDVVLRLPHCAEAWQQLGHALAEAKHDVDAVSALDRALELQPRSVVALSTLGQILARQGKTTEAIRKYEAALRMKPYWGPGHIGIGRVLDGLGRKAEADEHYRLALKNRLLTPGALTSLGRLCFEKGWLEESVANFKDSLNLDPADASTHVNLGVALLGLGRRAEAEQHFAEALRLNPAIAEAHVRLGFELGRRGNETGALEHFAEAARLKPDLLEARLNLGIALLKQNRQAEALAEFKEVLRLDPANAVALRNLQRLSAVAP